MATVDLDTAVTAETEDTVVATCQECSWKRRPSAENPDPDRDAKIHTATTGHWTVVRTVTTTAYARP